MTGPALVAGAANVMGADTVGIGLLLGVALLVDAYIGKRIVNRTPERLFVALVEVTLVIAGLHLIASF
ncbi:hypothetical protein [Anaerobaca lacustris]|uniref:GDT1 family protein n=1 Tax=Anaerobaca lacustris TaxID=3044600 RepID=A0AAW6TVM7_9BACT|nr:hypothetical protein [Sedimentisphaerales bacterium M17dextr]